jgi:hypothetical protein
MTRHLRVRSKAAKIVMAISSASVVRMRASCWFIIAI